MAILAPERPLQEEAPVAASAATAAPAPRQEIIIPIEIRQRAVPAAALQDLVKAGVDPVMARIYAARGIVPDTLEPGMSHLPRKETLEGTLEAGSMLAEAVLANKKIIIVGDYDADGATSTALMLRGLRAAGGDVDFLVPDRVKHGYGISPVLARMAKDMGGDVIVTVDNGVAAHAGINEAKALSMDVLVTDHHLQGDTLPAADCIVNPNMRGSQFASRNLAGVGVAFYVLGSLREALIARGQANPFAMAPLLDLVAIGTVGDVVPLDSMNRALVKMGIDRMRSDKAHAGVQALLSVAGKTALKANAEMMGFVLAPRINAAGRMETADIGIRMLATDDLGEALRMAARLDEINKDRKEKQVQMTEMALDMLDNIDVGGRKSLVVFDETFHEGVVGLVASRLKDRFNRPAAAFARAEDGTVKGSFRSVAGVHIRDVIDLVSRMAPGLVIKFGGHAMAAGATLAADGLERFTDCFERAVEELAASDAFESVVWTDGELTGPEMTVALADALQRENWGQAFPSPLFEGRFRVVSQRAVGANSNHTKLKLDVGGYSLDAMFFGRSEPLPTHVRLLYKVDVNEYKGERNLQLLVERMVG